MLMITRHALALTNGTDMFEVARFTVVSRTWTGIEYRFPKIVTSFYLNMRRVHLTAVVRMKGKF